MSIPVIVSLVLVMAVAVAAGVLVSRLMQYRTAEGIEESDFNPARYAPMKHLLDPEEAAFLAAQPGVGREAVTRFRSERKRIFRMYLNELAADFQDLHAQARELAAAAPEKNADLVEDLLQQQVRFWMSLANVEMQLTLDDLGVGHVDPRRLLEMVESVHAKVAQATAAPGPVPVS